MSGFFTEGRVFDLVLVCLVAEAALLTLLRRRSGRGLPLLDLAGFLGAGLGLVIAARAAVAGASWVWIAGGLTLALVAHAFDLARRWSKASGTETRVIQRGKPAV